MKTESAILEDLDEILRGKGVKAKILPIVERVRAKLAQTPKEVMAWEPIPLATFGNALPSAIRSGWVFILRAGINTGAERHPNSHQRMMSFDGSGDMQITTDLGSPWQSNVLRNDFKAPLEQRWVSIPQNVWHQPVVSKEGDWVVVSFHTVPAEELIEERPDPGSAAGTKQMVYLEEGGRKAEGSNEVTTIRRPTAWVPVAMSMAALAIVLIHIARFGVARDADEGTAAHLWQILMAGQLPIIAFFAIKWLPKNPKAAIAVLALQAVAGLAAMAPVFYFGW